MAIIDSKAIQAKAEKYLSTKEGKKKVKKALDTKVLNRSSSDMIYSPEEAGAAFATTLANEILSLAVPSGSDVSGGSLGLTAVEALMDINVSKPVSCGDGLYSIEISFAGDLTRPSLVPSKFDGVRNLAALLNNGYDARRSVHGIWHGEDKWSLMRRQGANFIGSAVTKFKSSCSSKYNIVDIEVDDIYEI